MEKSSEPWICYHLLRLLTTLVAAWQVTLLESLQKRCDFLEHVIKTVGLPNVQIVHSRAEVRQLLMEYYLLLCC
jgi:16S rRNA G527 N7-methylase RsmG